MVNKQDIITAIKNLDIFLKVSELKGTTVKLNKNGNPFVYVGGFNMVFQLNRGKKKWAFRVWHVPIGETKKRYQAISKYLTEKNLPYFADFIFDEKGILVNGSLIDTIRMEWLDGDLFKKYIETNLNKKSILENLAANFLKMCQDLRDNKISHGDLQEGNILVTKSGNIKLVDYDSICIPEIEGQKELVTGLKGYQHPSRFQGGKASLKADYFSELIIYLSILAIAEKPELWNKYQVKDTQYLLFTEKDFEDICRSDIYKDLFFLSPKIDKFLYLLTVYLKSKKYTDLKPFKEYLLPPVVKLPPIKPKRSVKPKISIKPKTPIKLTPKRSNKVNYRNNKSKNYYVVGIFIIILITIFIKKGIFQETNKMEIPNKVDHIVKTINPSIENNRRFQEANNKYKYSDFEGVIAKLREIKSLASIDGSEFYWLRGSSYAELNNNSQAIKDFTESIRLNPDNKKSYAERAYLYFQNKEYQKAIKDYSKAINMYYGKAKAYYYNMRGVCYSYQLNKKNAANDFLKAYNIDPSNNTYKQNFKSYKEKEVQKKPIPKYYLYKTKTLPYGKIGSLKKYPRTDSKNLRFNNKSEPVFVLEKTSRFYYKVQIDGTVGYISSSYLQNQDNKISKPKKEIKKESYIKVKVNSRVVKIYSKPIKKARYKAGEKRKSGTILKVKEYNNQFYELNYYDKGGRYRKGYILKSKTLKT